MTPLTWEQAKAYAQAKELEIAGLIPPQDVVEIVQNPKGGLFRCNAEQHLWTGISTVVLAPGTDATEVTKHLEEHFRTEDAFDVESWVNITQKYRVQLLSRTTAEGYIFGEGEQGTIVIDSWSPCFTLPDGVYPGGDF
ncbi:hypothetical protein [Microbacterium sp. XT11]|uniref:hypothetical protein n=1 Tax=Microbacterium sp. XT11 TaxID=367477 RepID=UPI001E523AC1|nr:hypothetical protein [Microbacterium sp. XT11]